MDKITWSITCIFSLQDTRLRTKETNRRKVKGRTKIFYANSINQSKDGVLISDKQTLNHKRSWDKKEYYIFLSFNTSRIYNNYNHLCTWWRTIKIYEAKTDKIQERNSSTIIVIDLNTPFSIMKIEQPDRR